MSQGLISAAVIVMVVSCVFALAMVCLRFIQSAALRHAVLSLGLLVACLAPLIRWIAPLRVEVAAPIAPVAPVFRGIESAALADPHIVIENVWVIENVLMGLWVCGVLFVLLPVAGGLIGLIRLRRMSAPYETTVVDMKMLTRRVNLQRPVDVRLGHSKLATSPLTWGIFRPAILLPADATGWSADRLEAVLLHELAHIRRLDCLWRLLARLACALFWFNPLVWIVARRHAAETELAADRLAISTGIRSSIYADALLAAAFHQRTRLNALTLSHAGKADIESRILAVLSNHSGNANSSVIIGSAGSVAIAFLVVACIQPHSSAIRPVTQNTGFSRPVVDEPISPSSPRPADTHKQSSDPHLNPESRDYIYAREVDPRFNPDAREYIYHKEIDPRLNPDSREYIYGKEIAPRDNPDSREYVPRT